MEHHLLLGLTAVIVLGVSAQWLAWRLNMPSILLLLTFGFLAGPVARLVLGESFEEYHPDKIFGSELLLSIVSLFVGLILYEGGLSLRFREITSVQKIVRNMVTVAIVVTWGLASVAAHYLVGLPWPVALLLGAVLVVSGPTVVMPMLRFLRPKGQLAPIMKWEGIVNDPIGALLAVLVFQAILAADPKVATANAIWGVCLTVVVGGGLGAIVALSFAWLIKKHQIPDYLHNAVSLMLVVLTFAVSNQVQSESGLFAVTVMGVVLANQRMAKIHHIIEFKEHLRVMLIATLFILLSARINIEDLQHLNWWSVVFVVVLIVIIRPAAVFLATLGTSLNIKEKILLSWLAPRGIVAAAVASVFAIELQDTYPNDASLLGVLTFFVIVATVATYGLTIAPLARWLGLSDPNPQGVLLVGGHSWARGLAEVLNKLQTRVVVLDSNRLNISQARMLGLPAHHGNVLADFLEEELDLHGVGRLMAVTPNNEVNTLAVQRFERVFGRKEVYQLVSSASSAKKVKSTESQGRPLFDDHLTFSQINERYAHGEVFRATKLTESFNFKAFKERYGVSMSPVMVKQASGTLRILTPDSEIKPVAGDTLICLGPKD